MLYVSNSDSMNLGIKQMNFYMSVINFLTIVAIHHYAFSSSYIPEMYGQKPIHIVVLWHCEQCTL